MTGTSLDPRSARKQRRLRAQRGLIIAWMVCFFAAPIVLWREWKILMEHGGITVGICAAAYIVFGVGFLWVFLSRYKKIAGEPDA